MANQEKLPRRIKNFGKEIISFLQESMRLILFSTVIFAVNFYFFYVGFRNTGNSFNTKTFLVLTIVFLIFNIAATLLIFLAKRKEWKIEKIYFLSALIFGLGFVAAIPAGRVPDEPSHFWRAYELSELRFFLETNEEGKIGQYIPENLISTINENVTEDAYKYILDHIDDPVSDNYIFYHGPADSYHFINYIPQVVGIWIGKIFNLPLIPMFYLSRVCNLIFCITVIYFCIKYLPILKKFLFLLGFTPITLQAFCSVSADGSIICAAAALITFALYMIYGTERKIIWKDLMFVFLSCLMLTVTKPIYAFVCLILFFIPRERFINNKRKILSIFIIGGITLAIVILHLSLIPSGPGRYETVNPGDQINFILSKPFEYAKILLHNTLPEIFFFTKLGIGSSLEWFQVGISDFYILLYIFAFLTICMEGNKKINTSLRIFAATVFFLVVVATFTFMYIQWSNVGDNLIDGVQGRYFVPVAILIPIVFLPSGDKAIEHTNRVLVRESSLYCLALYTAASVIITVICHHI